MSTTPEAEEETKEKVYVYVADWKAPHPLNPNRREIRVRAVDEYGHELAEFFGTNLGALKSDASAFTYPIDKPFRLLWVDDPHDHPVLGKLLTDEKVAERKLQEEAEKTHPRERYEREDLLLMRSQHHLCNGCQLHGVCALTNTPMFETQIVTVTGCMAYLPDEDENDDGLHRPE